MTPDGRPENIDDALKIYEDLPPLYQEIALIFLENCVLGRKKENDALLKWSEDLKNES